MRGIKIRGIIILFLLLILESNITSIISADISKINISDNMIIVSKTGGDYNSIQEAIENAIDGSIILISNGSYSEIIDISKSITIIGENRFTTKINPISDRNKYFFQIFKASYLR